MKRYGHRYGYIVLSTFGREVCLGSADVCGGGGGVVCVCVGREGGGGGRSRRWRRTESSDDGVCCRGEAAPATGHGETWGRGALVGGALLSG